MFGESKGKGITDEFKSTLGMITFEYYTFRGRGRGRFCFEMRFGLKHRWVTIKGSQFQKSVLKCREAKERYFDCVVLVF